MSTRFTIISVLFVAGLFISPPSVYGDKLTWVAPTHDIVGNPIAQSASLSYRIYVKDDNENAQFQLMTTVTSLSLDLRTAKPGCYKVYLTTLLAVDISSLESEPSETITACVNLPCGEIGTDGTAGKCDDTDPTPDAAVNPGPPTSVQIIQANSNW